MKRTPAIISTLIALLGTGLAAQDTNNISKTAPVSASLRLDMATLLGGKAEDRAHGMAVDAQGKVYLTAPVHSTDFPTTPNAYNKTHTGIYFATLSPAGVLLYSTFIGARGGANYAHDIAVDKAGCVYIAGNTTNPRFPITPGAFQTVFKGPANASHGDAFVVKLSPAGDRIIYSTFLGGADMDICGRIAVDAEGNAYVVGCTSSSDFPVTPGAFDTTFNGGGGGGRSDVFVAKLNPDGSKLVYCTYLGGAGLDVYTGNMVVNAVGSVYFPGTTTSPDFPTTENAFRRSYGGDAGGRGMGVAFRIHGDSATDVHVGATEEGGVDNPVACRA